jgi:hypothetical protein
MAVAPDVLEQVRAALHDDASVEAARIDVQAQADVVVLTGAVPTPEQAETAALLAARHAAAVDNRLLVDPHLREDPADPDVAAGTATRERPPRADQLTTQSSSGEPEAVGTDLQQDTDAALAENAPLDPPETPHSAPTASEQRGAPARDADVEDVAEPGDAPEEGDKSLADLSRTELEQRARPNRDAG